MGLPISVAICLPRFGFAPDRPMPPDIAAADQAAVMEVPAIDVAADAAAGRVVPPDRPGSWSSDPPEGVDFTWTLLARHGLRPLGFRGRLLFEASDRLQGPVISSRIAVHEVAGGGFVAAISHVSVIAGVSPRCFAEARASAEEIRGVFLDHDPLAWLPAEVLTHGLPADADAAALLSAAGARSASLRAGWTTLLAAVFTPASEPETMSADPEHQKQREPAL